MKKVISTENKPIKLWLDDIEDGALDQAKNLANLPFLYKHVAIMPDSHQGYGMPIGGVIATEGVIIPNAVGVDIGCGMCAVKTSLTEITQEDLKKIMGEIRKIIPLGFSHQRNKQDRNLMPKIVGANGKPYVFSTELAIVSIAGEYPNIVREYEKALTQIGTLGGGNHFIEIQKGSDGHIWIMIHSGSRNLGYQVANYYNEVAKKLNARWYSQVKESDELAFLPVDSKDGQDYIKEMQYCVEFAWANRKLMMKRIMEIFASKEKNYCDIKFDPIINIAHNYASLEEHCETCIDNQDNDSRLYELLLGDEHVTKVQDFLNGCRPLFHSCGGLLLLREASFQDISPSQVDALEQMSDVLHSLVPQLGPKRNHQKLLFCHCGLSFSDQTDEAYYTSLNKFGLGFCHLFGVEKVNHKLDRVLGRIFLGSEAYSLEHKILNTSIISQKHNIKQVWVHRKGATLARQGTIGIIPGSMGTKSYIVEGLGNKESFESCSHGAGRKMGRGEATRTLNLEEEQNKMEGVLGKPRTQQDLEEAPGAYKDIDVVMDNQKDLVKVLVELKPLAVIKG